ncbi:hypothetical protein KIN20_008061 [Parelaphostrongylus tenuis]|uniref:Uncharacterized protein n=1 Tax=Parelaphostrongylus tenuis TaxID=148309 RepID=A0AAD5MN98_PARTN|nr:hypothetical protein KIN20_008061 [Parelaphostrongylus tenuis]
MGRDVMMPKTRVAVSFRLTEREWTCPPARDTMHDGMGRWSTVPDSVIIQFQKVLGWVALYSWSCPDLVFLECRYGIFRCGDKTVVSSQCGKAPIKSPPEHRTLVILFINWEHLDSASVGNGIKRS